MTVRLFILFTFFSFMLPRTTFSQVNYHILVENGLTSIKDSINGIGEFKEGYAMIHDKKNQRNYVNKKGQKINPHGAIQAYSREESATFPKKYFVYGDPKTQYYGLLDTASQVVLKPDYYGITFFGSYITVKQNGKAAVLDENLKTVFDFKYDEITGVNNSFIIVTVGAKEEKDRQRGVFDLLSQKMVIPLDNYMVIHDLPWAFITRKDGYEGLFDLSGKMIIPLNKYTRLMPESGTSNFIHGLNLEGHTVIDSMGKIIIPAGLYDDIWSYTKETDMFLAKKNGKWGVINKKNQIIIPMEYNELEGSNDPAGILRATKDGSTFFISKKNYRLGSFKYSKNEGYRKYINNDTTGYVDESGQIYPFPQYKHLTDYKKKKGIMVCNRNDKWGLMDGDFKLVIDTVYDRISDTYKGYYFIVRKNNKEGVVDVYGKTHIPVTNNSVSSKGNFTFAVTNDDKQEIVTVKKIESE